MSVATPLITLLPAPGTAAAGSDDFTWISGTQLRHNTDGEVFTATYITKDPTTYVSVEQKSFGGGSWDDTSTNTEVNTGNPAMILFGSSARNCSNDYRVAARHAAQGSGGGAIDDKVLQITGNLVVVTNYQSATQAHYLTFDQKSGTDCHANDFDKPVGPRAITNSWQDFGGKWTDPTHIVLLGSSDIYTESSYNNGVMTLDGPTNGCGTNQLVVGTDPTSSYQSAASATWNIKAQISPNGQPLQCNNSTATIALTNKHTDVAITAQWPANTANIQDPTTASIDIVRATANNISGTPIQDKSFSGKSIDSSNTFTLAGSHGAVCPNDPKSIDTLIIANYQNAITATMTVYYPSGDRQTCRSATVPFVDLLNTFGNPTPPGGGGNPPSGDTCPVDASDETRWITCPSLNFLDKAAVAINGFIGLFLVFPVNEFFTGATQNVFNTFRDLGVALLVIAGLIMVVSQAADLEIFSAHTVRKALPRIIIAAIGISLAWPLLQFTITLFNDLGTWTGKVIIDIAAGTNGSGAGFGGFVLDSLATLIAGIGTAAWLGSFTIGGLLALLLSIILFLLLGLFVLLLRQIVILLCILVAPLAIAAYILPGTEKLWRFWKDTLLTTLLMFPILMAFLSAGAAMGHITGSVSGNPLFSVLSLFFYIVPYAMIPFAFKLAGGAMSQLVSLAEGQHHKSIESRLAGWRANDQKWKKEQQLEGKQPSFWTNAPGWRGRVGRGLLDFRRRTNTPGALSAGMLKEGRWHELERKHTALTAQKSVQEGTEISGNDDATYAGIHANNEADFMAIMTAGKNGTVVGSDGRVIAGVKGRGVDRGVAEQALHAMEANWGRIGQSNVRVSSFFAHAASNNGYFEGKDGLQEAANDILALEQAGLISRTAGIGAMRANAQNRPDLAASWGAWFKLLERGSAGVNDATMDRFYNEAVDGMQLGRLASAHPRAMMSLGNPLAIRAQTAAQNLDRMVHGLDLETGTKPATYTRDELEKALNAFVDNEADLGSLHDWIASASPQLGREAKQAYLSKETHLDVEALQKALGTGSGASRYAQEVVGLLSRQQLDANGAAVPLDKRTNEEWLESLRQAQWMLQRRHELVQQRNAALRDLSNPQADITMGGPGYTPLGGQPQQ